MKILYHHRTLGDGAEGIHIKEMVAAFRALGHEVQMLGPAGETSPDVESNKTRMLARIKRALPVFAFELIEIAYSIVSLLNIAIASNRSRPDLIYDRYITFNMGPVLASRLLRIPIFVEVNAPLAFERKLEIDERRLVFTRTAAWVERWVCNNATKTVVVSTPLKAHLEAHGVKPDRCFVLPNGANPKTFRPHPKNLELQRNLGIPEDSLIVGFSGVLRAWHGLGLLVQAIAELPVGETPIYLLVVGDGPYRSILETKIRDHGLESRVYITGRVPHAQVAEQVALFDIAVSPRATFYASPMKVIEYMAMAKPVVTPRTANFQDLIDEGENGLMFVENDALSLRETLQQLFASPELRNKLGTSARKKVELKLNWRNNAKRILALTDGSV